MANPPEPSNSHNKIAAYIGLIPTFDGLTEPDFFFNTIDDIAKLGAWDAREKLIVAKARLRNLALEHLTNSFELKNETNYEKFKKQFLDFFSQKSTLSAKQQDFSACKQLSEETIKQYAFRIKNYGQKFLNVGDSSSSEVKQMVDRVLLSKFISGLPRDSKLFVLNKGPQSFDDAVQMAETHELNAKFLAEDEINTASVSNTNSKALLDLIASQQNEFSKMMDTVTKKLNALSCQKREHSNCAKHYGQRSDFQSRRSTKDVKPFVRMNEPVDGRFSPRASRQYSNVRKATAYNPFTCRNPEWGRKETFNQHNLGEGRFQRKSHQHNQQFSTFRRGYSNDVSKND